MGVGGRRERERERRERTRDKFTCTSKREEHLRMCVRVEVMIGTWVGVRRGVCPRGRVQQRARKNEADAAMPTPRLRACPTPTCTTYNIAQRTLPPPRARTPPPALLHDC